MKWLIAARKFPKWAITGGIIVISGVIFCGWWISRKADDGGQADGGKNTASAQEIVIKPDEVVLAGNCLVEFRTGKILAKNWLEGFGDSLPPLAGIFPDNKLVIAANRGMAVAFGFDGKPKPMLSSDGKAIGAAAFSSSSPEVIYVREGNLWRGTVDWQSSSVIEPKRLTDTGVFRDDTFRGEWFLSGDALYVSILGRPHLISLVDGKVTPNQPPVGLLSRGGSPDRKLAALTLGRGEFAVADFEKDDLKRFPTVGELKQVRWLSASRVAVLGGYRRISVYDHGKGNVIGNFELKSQIKAIASNSTDGKYLLLATGDGGQFLNVETGQFTPVTHPMVNGAWVSKDTLLCSNSLTDSEIRGVWLYAVDGTKERISNLPIDSVIGSGGSEPVTEVNGGVVFVCDGDLWFYDTAAKSLRRVTQGEKLTPNLKALAVK